MDEVEHPERVTVSPARDTAAFVVGPRGDGPGPATGVWCGPLGQPPARIGEAVPATNLVFSPDGTRLAFGLQDDAGSRVRIVPAGVPGGDHDGATLALDGYVEALAWTDDGLLALAADPGADSASLSSGRPLPGAADDDPRIVVGGAGLRRLWQLDADVDADADADADADDGAGDGARVQLACPGMTVWEFTAVPGDGVVAVCSEDPREDGWYRPLLVHISADPTRSPRVLHRSEWQLSSPAVDPSGAHVAFVEGWASDRGLLAGDIRVLALDGSEGAPRPLHAGIDVTWLSWPESGRLWLAGWDHLGTAWGWCDDAVAGTAPVLHRDAAGCVNSRWHPEVVPLGGDGALTVRSTSELPPEVVCLAPDAAPQPWTALNAAAAGAERGLELHEVRWEGEDGLEIEGLLALPRGRGDSELPPLVVDIHGGPSIAFHHAWSMTWAEVLTAAGYAVLMPNPRGGVGRGQAFGRLNLADAGGAEMRDVVAGVRHCIAAGLVADGRAGAIGASYGGYLTAWAVTRPDVFACGVVIAGVTDLLSCRGTANNNAFYDYLMQGTPAEVGDQYLARSPIVAVDEHTVPTLILHGEQDQCVPLGQAHELHFALRAAGVSTELVVYPREGHQTHEPAHLADQRRRVGDWFRHHLVTP